MTLHGNLNPKEEHEENKNKVNITKSINISIWGSVTYTDILSI